MGLTNTTMFRRQWNRVVCLLWQLRFPIIRMIIPKFCKSRIKWKLPLKEEKQGLNFGFLGNVNKIFGIIIFEMGLFSFQAAEL